MWQAPSRAYGAITGYDVMFADTVSTSNSSVVQNLVLKDRDQLFHVVRESDLPAHNKLFTLPNIEGNWVGGELSLLKYLAVMHMLSHNF